MDKIGALTKRRLCKLPTSVGYEIHSICDALGRLITLTYDNGTKITYVYDAAGNRTTQGVTCGSGGC